MNKKAVFFILLSVVLVLPLTVSAQLHSYGPAVSIFYLLDVFISNLWIIFAAVAVFYFIVTGIMFLTAQGAPDKVTLARSAFLWGVVGVIVGIIAYSIITVVASIVGL